jgi:hypothetical protein
MADTASTSTRTNSIFTPHQIARLESINRFLIYLCDQDIVVAVLKLGFDDDELADGRLQYSIAAGFKVGLKQHMSSAVYDRLASGSADVKAKVSKVDRFENRWFPRTRNALRRFVPADQRDAVVDGFFRDMLQQPEGPLAVESVQKFIPRLEELANSTVPGTKEAYAALLKKGLRTELDAVKALLGELTTLPEVTAPVTPVSAEDIGKLAEERLAAYEKVNLWYTDWAGVFRDELSYHQCVRLGLVDMSGRSTVPPERPVQPAATTPTAPADGGKPAS